MEAARSNDYIQNILGLEVKNTPFIFCIIMLHNFRWRQISWSKYLCDKSSEKHSVIRIWVQWFVVKILLAITSLVPYFTVWLDSISYSKFLVIIKIISSKLESDIGCRHWRFVSFFISHQFLCCKICWWVYDTVVARAICNHDDLKKTVIPKFFFKLSY